MKRKFGYDDALDAFGVHGAGGTLGAMLTGVFATNAVNDGLKDAAGKVQPLGLVDGNAGQVVNQVIGVRDRLGSGDRGNAGHPEDRATLTVGVRVTQGTGDRRPGSEHARRRRI